MKKHIFRIISFLFAIVFATLTFTTAAFAAPVSKEEVVIEYQDDTAVRVDENAKEAEWATRGAWITGCFNGNSWSTRHLLRIDSKSVTPKFKVYTYNANGGGTSGKFSIRVTTPQDWTYSRTYYGKSNGCTITLDKGYSQYYIQICRYGTNPTNIANCYYWGFKATSSSTWWSY